MALTRVSSSSVHLICPCAVQPVFLLCSRLVPVLFVSVLSCSFCLLSSALFIHLSVCLCSTPPCPHCPPPACLLLSLSVRVIAPAHWISMRSSPLLPSFLRFLHFLVFSFRCSFVPSFVLVRSFVCLWCRPVVFSFAFVVCGFVSAVCFCVALLYESPGGNQVDGLPPAFHHYSQPIFQVEHLNIIEL